MGGNVLWWGQEDLLRQEIPGTPCHGESRTVEMAGFAPTSPEGWEA